MGSLLNLNPSNKHPSFFFCLQAMVTPLMKIYFDYGDFENSLLYLGGGIELMIVTILMTLISRKLSDRWTRILPIPWISKCLENSWENHWAFFAFLGIPINKFSLLIHQIFPTHRNSHRNHHLLLHVGIHSQIQTRFVQFKHFICTEGTSEVTHWYSNCLENPWSVLTTY